MSFGRNKSRAAHIQEVRSKRVEELETVLDRQLERKGKRKGGFPGGSDCKESACNRETWVRSLGQEDPLEKEMATHSSTLAWKVPWMEEPGGLQSMGLPSRTRLRPVRQEAREACLRERCRGGQLALCLEARR